MTVVDTAELQRTFPRPVRVGCPSCVCMFKPSLAVCDEMTRRCDVKPGIHSCFEFFLQMDPCFLSCSAQEDAGKSCLHVHSGPFFLAFALHRYYLVSY